MPSGKKSNIFLYTGKTLNGCFQTLFYTFLTVSDFVGQTSDAATGVASIIVNDAGKYFRR